MENGKMENGKWKKGENGKVNYIIYTTCFGGKNLDKYYKIIENLCSKRSILH